MTDLLARLDAAVDGLCPCGAQPREGSVYCGDDCRPTHIAEDTDARMAGDYATAMRWRPDLVTAGDDTNRTLLEEFQRGRFNAQVFEYADSDNLHFRLDDGHRFVGVDVDGLNCEANYREDAWLRLERELADPRHAVPDDPWVDVSAGWRARTRATALWRSAREAERQRVCAWLTANGINPDDVPESSEIRVHEGRLTVQVSQRNAEGAVLVELGRGVLTDEVTVPLVQPWEGPQPQYYDVDFDDDAQFGPVQRWGHYRLQQLTPEQQEHLVRNMVVATAGIRQAIEAVAAAARPAGESLGRAFQAARPTPAPLLEHPMLRVIEQRRRRQPYGPEQPRRAPRRLGPRRSR